MTKSQRPPYLIPQCAISQMEDVFQMIKPLSALYEPPFLTRVALALIRRNRADGSPSSMPPPMPD